MAFKIKRNDTRPRYVVPLVDNFEEVDEEPINLTTLKEVFLIMRKKGEEGEPKVKSKAMVLGDPKLGVVQYTWVVGDTDELGKFDVEFELVWEDGGKETVPNETFFEVIVGTDLG
jgi:hypothetical protein